jgi:hypothetical protein
MLPDALFALEDDLDEPLALFLTTTMAATTASNPSQTSHRRKRTEELPLTAEG